MHIPPQNGSSELSKHTTEKPEWREGKPNCAGIWVIYEFQEYFLGYVSTNLSDDEQEEYLTITIEEVETKLSDYKNIEYSYGPLPVRPA